MCTFAFTAASNLKINQCAVCQKMGTKKKDIRAKTLICLWSNDVCEKKEDDRIYWENVGKQIMCGWSNNESINFIGWW